MRTIRKMSWLPAMQRSCLWVMLAAAVVFWSASPTGAQVTLGPGGISTFISKGDATSDAGDLFAELEWEVPINAGETQWLGIVSSLAGDGGKGLGVRWYSQAGGGAAYPGIGLGVYTLGAQEVPELTERTVFVGGELLLEIAVPFGGGDLPVTALAGVYPSVLGNEATMFRIGAKIAPDLFK